MNFHGGLRCYACLCWFSVCDEQKCAGKFALAGGTNIDLLIACVYADDQICLCMFFFSFSSFWGCHVAWLH